eukprot:138079-Pleurochrysis_carterae.AAC.1
MSALFLPLPLLASHLSLFPLSRSRVPSVSLPRLRLSSLLFDGVFHTYLSLDARHEGIQIFAVLTKRDPLAHSSALAG